MVADRLIGTLRRVSVWGWLALAVFVLGSALRLEHALTFDHVNRGSDYHVHLLGVRWMQEHWTPFFHSHTVHYQVRSYPPLWYLLSALLLEFRDEQRLLASLSLLGWTLRHGVLWVILNEALPSRPWARLCGLTIHALLPLGVLIDGKVNPEGLHSGIFALALLALWRIERQLRTPSGASARAAVAFGAVAGLALLAKITGAMLLVIASAVFAWHALCRLRRFGPALAFRGLLVPALAAAAAWFIVGGWWAFINLVRLGHPFPHVWDVDLPNSSAVLSEPMLYRRPLGWALPFEWSQYLKFPILRTNTDPRPNFWAINVVGTWSDIYNRGFCRLQGGTLTHYAWSARDGFMSQGSDAWVVTSQCVAWLSWMARIGLFISAVAVLSLFVCLWRHVKTWGERASLTLVCVPFICTASAMKLGLAYPYDFMAAVNPRYLLSQVMPMSACLAFALGELEAVTARRSAYGLVSRIAIGVVFGATVLIAGMLVIERFAR